MPNSIEANQALKLNEEQLQRAIQEAPIPTIMQTEDGQVLQLNRSWTELTGYKQSDMPTFDNWVTNAVYDGAEEVRKHMHELFKGNKTSINVEFTVRTHNKGIRYWSFSASSPGTLLDGRRFVIGMAVDVTERKKAKDASTYKNQELELISGITSKLLLGQPPEQLANEICQKVVHFLDFDVFFNFLIDKEKQMLHLNTYGGIPAEEAKNVEWLPIGESICGCAVQQNHRIISEDIQNNGDVRAALVRSYGVQAYCATPLISEGKVIGTLSFGSKKKTSFAPDELALMQTVADHVSIAMARKKAEEALRQSESKYRLIVDTAEEGIWVATPDGKATYVNQKMADMLGYPKEDILGKAGLEFLDKPHAEEVIINRKILDRKEGIQTECKFIRKDGSTLWTIANTSPVFDNLGNHVANIAMHTNITKRKKTEEALKKSEEQAQRRAEELQTLMDIVPVGIWISNDPECKNIVGNYTANRFYEAIEGENVSAGPAGGGEQDTTRRFFRNGKELLPQELPMQEAARKNIEIKDSELEVVIPSGKKLIILGSARPLLNTNKKVRGCLGAFIDITERKKGEQALQKMNEELDKRVQERTVELALERERLFNVLEGIPVMVILLTSDHKVAFANRSFRKRFGEPSDRNCYDFCFGNKEPCSFCESYKVLETGKPHHWQVNPPDGSVIDAYDFPFTDTDGTKMVLEMDIDITEQKKLEKSLKGAERLAAIGATAGMVGHDIRNPLQAITGEIYLVNDSLSELPDSTQKNEMKESMESITENVGYINKIVADLQDYARPLKPEYSLFDLPKLINDALNGITLPENIKLSVDMEQIPAIRSDQTYLRRSITNLVNNAIQAMPDGGALSVNYRIRKEKVIIGISDTGVGIPEHVKAKLFTPMMTTKSKGQGLGLAVVKRLIEALNGCITFDSVEGKGTKFIIELPINR